jgi:trehalose-phosphatase
VTPHRTPDGGTEDIDTGAATASAIARVVAIAHTRPILVITDFDGTLSPIVEVASDASIVPGARLALERLLAAAAALPEGTLEIAVLSGRDAGDVARRVGVPGIRYLGQHGIERGTLGSEAGATPVVEMDPVLAGSGRDLLRLAERASERIGRPAWLSIENKGASIGLHYRRADDPQAARMAIHAGLDAATRDLGLGRVDRLESRRVVELRPGGTPGKGEAAQRLIEAVRPASILITGDDRTDVDGFRVVRRLRDTTPMQALVVGVSGAAETPPELLETVDVMLPSPDAAAAVLDALAAAVEAPTKR